MTQEYFLKIALLLILSYFIGAIPSGVIIGNVFFHKDIRNFGSGNIGTTNAFRILGKSAGIIVLLLDMLKGALAAAIPIFVGVTSPHWIILFIGLGAIIGHTKSIFINFSGGKAVATSVGVLLVYNPILFVLAWISFLTVLLTSRMVSLASLSTMVIVSILSLFFNDPALTAVACILTVYIFYRHRENIIRIKNGTESKINFSSKSKK